jgi:hypothetical protein
VFSSDRKGDMMTLDSVRDPGWPHPIGFPSGIGWGEKCRGFVPLDEPRMNFVVVCHMMVEGT